MENENNNEHEDEDRTEEDVIEDIHECLAQLGNILRDMKDYTRELPEDDNRKDRIFKYIESISEAAEDRTILGDALDDPGIAGEYP